MTVKEILDSGILEFEKFQGLNEDEMATHALSISEFCESKETRQFLDLFVKKPNNLQVAES